MDVQRRHMAAAIASQLLPLPALAGDRDRLCACHVLCWKRRGQVDDPRGPEEVPAENPEILQGAQGANHSLSHRCGQAAGTVTDDFLEEKKMKKWGC